MPHKKAPPQPAAAPTTVSGRWLMIAVSLASVGAGVCAWGALCLLFWQGSWQLLYHPTSTVTRTPASASLTFDPVGFATTDAGEPLLNVLAFDYRGYGQSQFVHPSETRWREDTESAVQYLTGTRHLAANAIILDGNDLGANLALEVGAQHPELAGIVLQDPLDSPANAIFNDPRAHMVPAHLLVSDRFDAASPAAALRLPSLWFLQSAQPGKGAPPGDPEAFKSLTAPKMLVWLDPASNAMKNMQDALSRWLDDLHPQTRNLVR